MRKVIFLIIGMVLVSGLRPVSAQDDDAELIRQLTNTWVQATNAGNIEGLLTIITDDAVIIGPGAPPLRGKESIEAPTVITMPPTTLIIQLRSMRSGCSATPPMSGLW